MSTFAIVVVCLTAAWITMMVAVTYGLIAIIKAADK